MKSDYIVKIVWGVEIKYSRLEMRKVRTFQRNSLEPSRMETTTVFEIKSQTQLDEAFGGGRSPDGKISWKKSNFTPCRNGVLDIDQCPKSRRRELLQLLF